MSTRQHAASQHNIESSLYTSNDWSLVNAYEGVNNLFIFSPILSKRAITNSNLCTGELATLSERDYVGKKKNNEKSIKSALHTRPQAKTEFAGEKVVLRLHSTRRSKLDDSIIQE
jgi:hypothetical protein